MIDTDGVVLLRMFLDIRKEKEHETAYIATLAEIMRKSADQYENLTE